MIRESDVLVLIRQVQEMIQSETPNHLNLRLVHELAVYWALTNQPSTIGDDNPCGAV